MDVLLARDRYLLRLVFKELDVIVDVEDVFVELGEVMELWSVDERRVLVLLQMTKKNQGLRMSLSLTSFLMVSSRLSTLSSFSRS